MKEKLLYFDLRTQFDGCEHRVVLSSKPHLFVLAYDIGGDQIYLNYITCMETCITFSHYKYFSNDALTVLWKNIEGHNEKGLVIRSSSDIYIFRIKPTKQ